MHPRRAVRLALLVCALLAACGEPTYCRETPDPSREPLSLGAPWNGRLRGAARLADSPFARTLPRRHARRCLDWGTPRLVHAIERAGRRVAQEHPGSPPLGVGDLARARGGPIAYSRSHQAGRDADLAFYQTDPGGRPVAAEDIARFDASLRAAGEPRRRFDLARNWTLVRALLAEPEIDVAALFISEPLRAALLAHARQQRAVPPALLASAASALHQPAGAPPHDDHLHLRIRCTAAERARGCRDG